MHDPFRPHSNAQLVREAQIGLTLVSILLALFVYVAFYRISGYGRTIPAHVRAAPIAEQVWPNSRPPALERSRVVGPAVVAAERAADTDSAAETMADRRFATTAKPVVDVVTTPIDRTFSQRLDRPSNRIRGNSIRNDGNREVDGEKPPAAFAVSGPDDPFNMQSSSATSLTAKTHSTTKLFPTPNVQGDSQAPTRIQLTEFVEKQDPKPSLESPQPIDLASPQPLDVNELRVNAAPNLSTSINPINKTFVEPVNDTESNNDFPAQTSNELRPIPSPLPTAHLIASEFETETSNRRPDAPLPTNLTTENVGAVAEAVDDSTPTPAPRNVSDSYIHIVRDGESLWTIAQLHYDDGRYFRVLYELNQQQILDVDRLEPGTRLDTPPAAILIQRWPELCPENSTLTADNSFFGESISTNVHETQAGDTLFEIARQRLGQASRYLEIMQLNADRLPVGADHLSPLPGHIRLKMPE